MEHEFSTDYFYAFVFKYSPDDEEEIIMARPTKIYKNDILFHFSWGHYSLGEFIKKSDIIGFGNEKGEVKFNWDNYENKIITKSI